jgi:hypothetical protein
VSATTWEPRIRWHMNPIHGVRGILVGAAVGAASSEGITAAIITAGSTVLVVIIGPFVTDWVRNRRRSHVNHATEHEQELLHLTEHLLTEMETRDAEITRLREQLRRRRS